MKKTIVTLSLIATTSLFAYDTFKTQVAVTAGYNKFDSASKMEDTSLFGIRATVYENEVNMYGLQVGYEGATGIDYEDSSKKTDLHRIFTHLVVDGEEEYDVTPYLFLGAGYEYLSEEIKGEPSQGFIDLGLGFKYFFDRNFNVLLETRAVGKFDTRDLDLTTNLGLGYMFGGKKSLKQKPIIALDKNEEDLEKIVPKRSIDIVNAPVVKEVQIQAYTYPEEVSAMKIDKGERVMPYKELSPIVTTPVVSYEEVAVSSGDYYVQMAAYNHTATEPLMNSLAKRGYANTLVHPRGNTSLVLVGPYMSREDALSAKRSLKSIKSDAFLYRMQ